MLTGVRKIKQPRNRFHGFPVVSPGPATFRLRYAGRFRSIHPQQPMLEHHRTGPSGPWRPTENGSRCVCKQSRPLVEILSSKRHVHGDNSRRAHQKFDLVNSLQATDPSVPSMLAIRWCRAVGTSLAVLQKREFLHTKMKSLRGKKSWRKGVAVWPSAS